VRAAAGWIRSPRADLGVALAWIPFACGIAAVHTNPDSVVALLAALSLFSFLHQPLTLPLVYGDREQFAQRRRLFVVAPFALVVAIAVGLWVSFALVAIVGGVWNMEHTLMQRYGFARIYGRKAGEDDGRLERAMLVSWLVVTLLSVAADPETPHRILTLQLGRLNSEGLDVLVSFRPYAVAVLVPSVAVGAVLTVQWLRIERDRGRRGVASGPKRLYVASTAVLFAWAVFVDPVAGLAGYAGAHAVEYFFIVDHRLRPGRGGRERVRFFACYLGAFGLLYRFEYGTEIWTWCVLFFGGLHFLFDSFIWKQRRPALAAQSMPANVSA
jgi:hypothetical protein